MENEVEVMRIVRVPPMGKMVVISESNRYQHISQVPDDTLRQRIMAAIGELVTFADGYSTLLDAGLAPPLSAEIASEATSEDEKLEQQQLAFVESLKLERDVMYVEDAEVSGSVHPVGLEETDLIGDTGPLSIAGLINPILQKHVNAEPELEGRSIRLATEANGGLYIVVDGQVYQRPEDIPDIEVRKVLRAALKEWDST